MKKVTVIIISSIMVIVMCCACADSSSDGAGDRATLGGVSFDVPEGFELDKEVYSGGIGEEYLSFVGGYSANDYKILSIEYWTVDENITFEDRQFETKDELSVNCEACGDVDIVYGTTIVPGSTNDFFGNEAVCRFVIDDKEYMVGIGSTYPSEGEREYAQDEDFDFEIETIKAILQSLERTEQ